MRRFTKLMIGLALLATTAPEFVGGARDKTMSDAPRLVPPAYVTQLAEYTFDNGFGGPDPQGWTSVDLTATPDSFTHVDDFSGMPSPPWAPLEGTQSMWIGVRAEDAPCNYVVAPGYGNAWFERIESVPFATSGDVTISYEIAYDIEPYYDFVYFDYLSKTGTWRNLETYIGTFDREEEVDTFTVPADSIGATTRFRFTFESDNTASDEDSSYPFVGGSDGAMVLDSLTVSDTTGVVDYQDFESVPVYARATSDGHWYAGTTEFFGDFAGLFDGSTVLQEDPVDTNNTYLWGFFNGSPDTYACGGHPGQAARPLAPIGGQVSPKLFMENGIVSPIIDISKDKDGNPVASPPDQIAVGADVYYDKVPGNNFDFLMLIRVMHNGCLAAPWSYLFQSTSPADGEWVREQAVANLSAYLPGVTHVQVMMLVRAQESSDAQTCHSHAPLIDNVSIEGWFDTLTDADTPAPPGYALRGNVPNPFNPVTTISFDVPEPGGDVSVKVYDVRGAHVATLAEGARTAGTHFVEWDGRDASGLRVASGVYFYRMIAPGFDRTRKMVLLK